jgi:SP family myo-inositol transporter-like MFS transporter 13
LCAVTKGYLLILASIYSGASEEVLTFKLTVAEQYVAATTKLQMEYSPLQRVKIYWTHKPYRRAIITVSAIQAFGQLTGYNTLLYYSGTIFGLLGLKNASAAGLIPTGGNALFLVCQAAVITLQRADSYSS